jgi:diketogulonate reductase-like aldo/keto reductase
MGMSHAYTGAGTDEDESIRDGIVPIPGTKRVSRLEENVAADGIRLSAEQTATLDNLAPAAGAHHNEEQMRLLER